MAEKDNNVVNHPTHYNKYPVETIDMIERIFGLEDAEKWCIITAFKYRMRAGYKDNLTQDLEKEQWYLRKAEEIRHRIKNIQECKSDPHARLNAIRTAFESAYDAETIVDKVYKALWGEEKEQEPMGEIAPLTEEQEKVAKEVSRKMTDAIMKQLEREK